MIVSDQSLSDSDAMLLVTRPLMRAFAILALLGHGPIAAAATDRSFVVDSAGQCIWPRDFTAVPLGSRQQVHQFWDQVVERHRTAQRRINTETAAAMRDQHVYDRTGLTEEQQRLRERIGANARARMHEDEAAYQQEYDSLIASLPEADRIPAGRALAVLVMPVEKSCPHGFQMDPLKLHGDSRLSL